MAEILHHLRRMKPCRIMVTIFNHVFRLSIEGFHWRIPSTVRKMHGENKMNLSPKVAKTSIKFSEWNYHHFVTFGILRLMKPRRSKQIKQKTPGNNHLVNVPYSDFSRLRQPVVASACCVNHLKRSGFSSSNTWRLHENELTNQPINHNHKNQQQQQQQRRRQQQQQQQPQPQPQETCRRPASSNKSNLGSSKSAICLARLCLGSSYLGSNNPSRAPRMPVTRHHQDITFVVGKPYKL